MPSMPLPARSPLSPRSLRRLAAAFALAVLGGLAWCLLGLQWRLGLFFTVAPAFVYLTVAFRSVLERRPEALFAAVALPVGLLMCLYMPAIVSVSWDGYVHYRDANRLAQGPTLTETEADVINYDMDGIYTVGLVPWGTSDDDWTPNWRGVLTEQGKEKADGVLEEASRSVSKTAPNSHALSAAALGHLPNAAGLWLGSALGLPYLGRLLLGRVTNLLFYLALSLLAIGRLRSGKRLLCALSLLPVTFFEACNYSYDPYCIGMIVLAAASFARELQERDKPMTLGGAAWIFVPFTLGILIKPTFIPAGLMMLFMPRDKFKSRGAHALWIVGWVFVALGVTASFAAPFFSSGGEGYSDGRGGETAIDAGKQLAFVLAHPLRFLAVMAGWWVTYLNPVELFNHLFVDLCYLPSPVAFPVLAAAELVLCAWSAACDRTRADDGWPSRGLRVGLLAGLVLAYSLSALSLYLAYTNVYAPYILGMQTRYLLVFLGPVLLILLNFGTRGRAWVAREVYPALPAPLRPSAEAVAKAADDAAAEDPVFASGWFWLQTALPWLLLTLGFVVRF